MLITFAAVSFVIVVCLNRNAFSSDCHLRTPVFQSLSPQKGSEWCSEEPYDSVIWGLEHALYYGLGSFGGRRREYV